MASIFASLGIEAEEQLSFFQERQGFWSLLSIAVETPYDVMALTHYLYTFVPASLEIRFHMILLVWRYVDGRVRNCIFIVLFSLFQFPSSCAG